MIRKNFLRLCLASLALTAAIALESAPASASGGFCADFDGRRCFTEYETRFCTWLGCCGYISEETCQCLDGHWNCPDSPECPPDFCP